jgi:dTDP-4-dehydrorhamnose reductase
LNQHLTKIVVFGKDGQLGKAFQEIFQDNSHVIFVDRQMCDLTQTSQIKSTLNQYQPQIIFNAAAYTAVDLAEKESATAFAINARAPEVMAKYICQISHGVFVHFSTDYIFDGLQKEPYQETDIPNPLSMYGKSKLTGELAIQHIFEQSTTTTSSYLILRTSWVYGDGGNFMKTMLKLAQERDHLNVIADQFGVPTSADWLAKIAKDLTQSQAPSGIYHVVPDGKTTWYELARFVIQTGKDLGLNLKVHPENIQAIHATEYPVPAPRPYNSLMDNRKLKEALNLTNLSDFPEWKASAQEYVKNLLKQKN